MSITLALRGTASARPIGKPVERAFLDLKKGGVGDRLRHVEQQEVIEEDVCAGDQRGRRPVCAAIAHVPIGQTVDQALLEQGTKILGDREWRLLIPKVAQVLRPAMVGLLSRMLVCSGLPIQS